MVVFLWIWIGCLLQKKICEHSIKHSVLLICQGFCKFWPKETFKIHFNSSNLCTYSQFLMDIWYYFNCKKISKKTGHNALVLLPILRPFLFIRELIFKWSSCISHERPTPLHSDALWSYLIQSAFFVCFVCFWLLQRGIRAAFLGI